MTIQPVHLMLCQPVHGGYDPYMCHSLGCLRTPRPGDAEFPGTTQRMQAIDLDVVRARTLLTVQALQVGDTLAQGAPRVSHLLFIDSDMVFQPDALMRLAAHDKPIVGGLCFSRRSPFNPVIAKWNTRFGTDKPVLGWCYDYPKDNLFRCDVTGAAFLLVKREVFEAISAKFEATSWWEQTEGESEDFSFCKKAQACGYEIFVDTGVDIGHRGVVTINAEFARVNRGHEWSKYEEPSEAQVGIPQASIVLPTYNEKLPWLKAAIHSALSQSVPVELIVVDDGSTPAVSTLPLPFESFKLLRHANNLGPAEALNTGIRAMSTEWFAWLADDDLFSPTKIEKQLAFMAATGAKCSYHPYNAFQHGGGKMEVYTPCSQWSNMREQRRVLSSFCPFNGSTAMIHKSVFADVGVFDPTYGYGTDWELWCRIGRKYLWRALPDVLASRRVGDNLTSEIEADEAKRAVRDAQDARIRETYAVHQCEHCGQDLP